MFGCGIEPRPVLHTAQSFEMKHHSSLATSHTHTHTHAYIDLLHTYIHTYMPSNIAHTLHTDHKDTHTCITFSFSRINMHTHTHTHTHTHSHTRHTVSSGLIYNESQSAERERERERERGWGRFSGPNSSLRFGDQSTHTTTNWPSSSTGSRACISLCCFTNTHTHKEQRTVESQPAVCHT